MLSNEYEPRHISEVATDKSDGKPSTSGKEIVIRWYERPINGNLYLSKSIARDLRRWLGHRGFENGGKIGVATRDATEAEVERAVKIRAAFVAIAHYDFEAYSPPAMAEQKKIKKTHNGSGAVSEELI